MPPDAFTQNRTDVADFDESIIGFIYIMNGYEHIFEHESGCEARGLPYG